jgi:hypothetical protein
LNLVGGRKCALGKITAALLFCNSKGKRASLFMINPVDVGFGLDKKCTPQGRRFGFKAERTRST